MKQYERFGECLKRLLKKRGLANAEFARQMGVKSRNSVSRILNDAVSSELAGSFYAELKAKDVLHLSREEVAELDAALEISRVGYSDHLSNVAIGHLLQGKNIEQKDYACMDVEADSCQTLAQVLKEYAACQRVEMIIFSCSSSHFCRTLAEAMYAPDRVCQPEITHYMYAGSDEIVQNIVAIQPLLYAPWYQAFFIEPDSTAPETEALFRASFIMTHLVRPDGTDAWDELLVVDGVRMCRVPQRGGGYFSFIRQLLWENRSVLEPVKSNFNDMIHEFSDYFQYVESYRLLEKGRDVYSLKPDVPINFIHPDILLPIIQEALSGDDIVLPEEQAKQLIDHFYTNQMFRWRNFFTTRKVTHIVFSRRAMERFVRTGHQSDHFFAMRAYTPAERRAILENLREHLMHNPFFWVYLIKDEDDPARLPAEITLYDGCGVLFTKAYTDYNLSCNDHSEAMINHAEFSRKFKSFFLKELLVNHVLTYQETLACFDDWIARLS